MHGRVLRDFYHDLIMAGYSLIPRPSEGGGPREGPGMRLGRILATQYSHAVFTLNLRDFCNDLIMGGFYITCKVFPVFTFVTVYGKIYTR